MTTALQIGPNDLGRLMTLEEFEQADFEPGWRYELIEGILTVSPAPELPHDRIFDWIYGAHREYCRQKPEIINYVSSHARVFVPGRRRVTNPQPDVTCYADYPLDEPFEEVSWRDLSPLLVVEIVSPETADKDLVRNVELYRRVASIKEYWVIDTRVSVEQPTLRVYRRRGSNWRVFETAYGETYTTKLLPDFELLVDPRS
jgi:Uma2 family endonuclease